MTNKLSRLLSKILRTQPKYITTTVSSTSSAPEKQLPPVHMPRHVAIIMDGNGRWAQNRGLPRSAGHAAGTEALRDIIRASDDWGIKALSIYAFSTENWARSKEEVSALMGLLLKYFASEIDEKCVESMLYTADIPDVDLLIRTSGEQRTSNFLPWQTAYAEMIFDSVLWPDYDRAHYLKNLREYAARDRRFGGVKAPAAAAEPEVES